MICYLKTIFSFISFPGNKMGLLLLTCFISMNMPASVVRLQTEYLENPVGIDVSQPRFSWQMRSSERGARQTAYRIVVARDSGLRDIVWNSGRVDSDVSLHVRYGGPALSPSTRYYWRVTVWDEKEREESSIRAFFETGLLRSGWSGARWIMADTTVSAEARGGGMPMFRKAFRVQEKVVSARLYCSALGIYDMFINGRRVGTPQSDGRMVCDELKPGWTDYRKTAHYQTYDVTSLLDCGDNVIGAQVCPGWFTGDVSHGEYGRNETALIAKLVMWFADGTKRVVTTDTSWLSSADGALRMGDIYHGETYDARLESNWTQAGFDDSKWRPTLVNPFFRGTLTGFAGPAVRVRTEMTRTVESTTIYRGANGDSINVVSASKGLRNVVLRKGETAVLDFGQNIVGWVRFRAKGASGTTMRLRYAEMLNDTGNPERGDDGPAGSIYTANLRSAKATQLYTMRGDKRGEEHSPAATFFGFRYCEITADADVEILTVEGCVVGSELAESSSFECSNQMVNHLYRNVLWGQRGNYLSIPTDCPQRDERLGWAGDTQVFCRAGSFNANVCAFFEKWMGDMRDSQRDDGAYPGVAPHNWGVPHGQSAWADAGIIVPWTMYLVYGDKGIIEDNYRSMERYMNYLAQQQFDGFLYNGGGTEWGDWLAYEPTDKRYISVCYYAYTAKLMAAMSEVMSKAQGDVYSLMADFYESLYNKIKQEFIGRYTDASGNLTQQSQTACLLALKLDLLPNRAATERTLKTLTDKIEANGNKLSTGFVGTAILNQTLSSYGATSVAYNLLMQRDNPSWLYSIDQGATTIWERWDSYTREKGFNTVVMNSFNHYSYGAVAEWLFTTVAGIDADPGNPGYKHILLSPSPDNRAQLPKGQKRMTWAKATYGSPYGDISSAWTVEGEGSVTYRFTIPANTTATLILPLPSANCKITESGRDVEKADGVSEFTKDGRQAMMELQSGKYVFRVNTLY